MLANAGPSAKWLAGWLAAWAILISCSTGDACDTPVYRYAMYRWEPAPYEVYYFHRGDIDKSAADLHKLVNDASHAKDAPANVLLLPVNLDEDEELKSVPQDVRQAWLGQEKPSVPSYMVVSPQGGQIFMGDLDQSTIKSLLDSPTRRQLAKLLGSGKATVLVLLTGTDKAANDEAEKLLAEVTKDIADGKIELYTAPPTGGLFGGDEAAPKPKDAPPVTIAHLRIDRNDPAEQWLVKSLLLVEPDLRDEEFVDKPMVFGIYGRGRALPPYIGKGVDRENLIGCVEFVTSACSCTVKEQNPGLDLLVKHDWTSAAETLASMYGAEEGNETQYSAADFFPDLIIPAATDSESAEPETNDPVAVAVQDSGDATTVETDAPTETQPEDARRDDVGDAVSDESEKPETAPIAKSSPDDSSTTVAVAPTATEPASSDLETQGPIASMFTVGGTLALALVVLFAVTFFVLRPK